MSLLARTVRAAQPAMRAAATRAGQTTGHTRGGSQPDRAEHDWTTQEGKETHRNETSRGGGADDTAIKYHGSFCHLVSPSLVFLSSLVTAPIPLPFRPILHSHAPRACSISHLPSVPLPSLSPLSFSSFCFVCLSSPLLPCLLHSFYFDFPVDRRTHRAGCSIRETSTSRTVWSATQQQQHTNMKQIVGSILMKCTILNCALSICLFALVLFRGGGE